LSLRLDPACSGLLGSLAERRLQDAVSDKLGRPLRLELTVDAAATETPAQRGAREKQARQVAIEDDVAGDPLVLAMQENFGAEIVPDSIRGTE
jgi:DNA polymerase-3 subunit gamma/tau